MKMVVNSEILKILQKELDNNSFNLESIGLDAQGSTLTITIDLETGAKNNMQENPACFEGWAIILKTYIMDKYPKTYDKVKLCCPNIELPTETDDGRLHFNRFLYRVLRFDEQYDWFTIDEKLADIITNFKTLLQKHLVNNYPIGKAKGFNNEDKPSEHIIECILSKKTPQNNGKTLHTYFNKIGVPYDDLIINHQLPVGLFEEEISEATKVFTGKKSALDLWGFSNAKPNDFYIFELKYNNPMIGTITEAFFYANYMHDLLHRNGAFSLSDNGKDNFRNYSTIYSLKDKDINRIHAVMLLDKNSIHPAITPELLAVLNKGSQKAIEYSLAEYEFDEEKRIITDIVPK